MAALLEALVQAPTPLFGPAAQDGGRDGVQAGEESARLRCALANAGALPAGGAGAGDQAPADATADAAAPDRAAPAAASPAGEVIGRCGAALGLVVGAGDAETARGAIATALSRLREVLHHTRPAGPGEGAQSPAATTAPGSDAGAGEVGSADAGR